MALPSLLTGRGNSRPGSEFVSESSVVFVEGHSFSAPHMLIAAVLRIITIAINRVLTGDA
jgi:hypothetical protein